MTDRQTGSYTHERLIALEDSHRRLLEVLSDIVDGCHIDAGCQTSDLYLVSQDAIESAKQIRKEAGL